VSIDSYLIWTETYDPDSDLDHPSEETSTEFTYINTLVAEEFEFDLSTGAITISSGQALYTILNSSLAEIGRMDGDSSDTIYSQPQILFQINVEKYRSVADLRNMTQEQVDKIATAQAVEAAILEYNYQFNLATQTQLSFNEIVYTAIITGISTVMTMAATYGIGSVLGSLTSGKAFSDIIDYSTSFTIGTVLKAVVKETMQEIFIDPWIEATVSGLIRRAGGDAIMQAIFSTLAESGREALTGIFNFRGKDTDGSRTLIEVLDQRYYENGLTPTLQDVSAVMQELTADIDAQQIQAQEDAVSLRKAMKAISFVATALAFTASMFLGPVAALTYTTLKTFCYTEEISLKGIFKKIFNPVLSISTRNDREISDSRRLSMVIALKNTKIGSILAYGAKILNNKIMGFTRIVEKVNSKSDFKEIFIEKTIGPPGDTITIQYHEGMTTQDVARAVAKELTLKEEDFFLSLEGITLSSEDVIPSSAKLMLMPSSIARANYHLQERKELLYDLVTIFHLSLDQISMLLYKDVNILENILINYKRITKEKQAFLINELMYNIYMIDHYNSYIFKFYSDLGDLRDIQIKALEKCYNFLIKEGYNADSIGLSLSEIRDPQLYETLKRIVDDKSKNMLPRKHSNYEARIEWYQPLDEKIEHIIMNYFKIPIQDNSFQKVRLTFHLRNIFKMKARTFMKDQTEVEGLMKNRPIRIWDQVYQNAVNKVEKRLNELIIKSGKTEMEILNNLGFNSKLEMIYRELIESSKRTNIDVTNFILSIRN